MGTRALVQVRDLRKYYPIFAGPWRRVVGYVRAVDGITFSLGEGETLGLVGESGCGKTTAGRTLLRLYEPTGGEVFFAGKNIFELPPREMTPLRREMQMIFQDSSGALNPRLTVEALIAEPIYWHRLAPGREALRVGELMDVVGLPASCRRRLPYELSSGQRQRIGIARALACQPRFIVCDEPVSALDVSIKAQIINLLLELQEQFGLTYLFISHDLAVVNYISHRVAVMYGGQLVEQASADRLFTQPLHPYTQALVAALPRLQGGSQRALLQGEAGLVESSQGCVFGPRCPQLRDECLTGRPLYKEHSPGHWIACYLYQ
ncbi:MAG: ABC transporter ATP-binding protein [Limnochordia bacterium]